MKSLISTFQNTYSRLEGEDEMSLLDYLDLCKKDPSVYASAPERMLLAIGQPTVIDTSTDDRLGRIFFNRKINQYPAFKDFFGMEDTIEQIVSYFKHAAQGLEESKQILYLLGPVGGGKSSLAEKLKSLMQDQPIYVLVDPNEKDASLRMSPVFESPLGLFDVKHAGDLAEYGIPKRALKTVASPWALQKLKEFKGDLTKFSVVRMYPDRDNEIALSRVEPGDENNQDISSLVGKINIRRLDEYEQNHPYAYSYSGGLCRANQGMLEFTEMFKASIKTLNPLLMATQDRFYKGTEAISSIPFVGIVMAHSNEAEWTSFRNNKNNEAFLDRVYIVRVPYCLRVKEEVLIYSKLLASSTLAEAPCAPGTMEMLAQWSILTRLIEPANSNVFSKLRVYDGENTKETDNKAKPLQEYKDDVREKNEGMNGMSTRFAFKLLSKVFNFDSEEVGANPVHLMYLLEEAIYKEGLPKEQQDKYISFIKDQLQDKYFEYLEKDVRSAFLYSFSDTCQTIFENYIKLADAWVSDKGYRDPDTNTMFDREALEKELSKIERPAGINNSKDFRNEIVNFSLRYQAKNNDSYPRWDSYEKMKNLIEQKTLAATDELLPVMSFGNKRDENETKKHDTFVGQMISKGYTKRMTKIVVEWFIRTRQSR